MKAALVLEDGTILEGSGFGAEKTTSGELVFNTGMTGYQEALTDPSYNGQILMMTYPLIGNYGINFEDGESPKIQAEGFVVRQKCDRPQHRLARQTLDEFLKSQSVAGIADIDTRMLTIKTRQHGTLRSVLKTYSNGSLNKKERARLVNLVKRMRPPEKNNLVAEVSTAKAQIINQNKHGPKIVLIDCGVKENIIRELVLRHCTVIRMPYNVRPAQINKFKPDGILISNGPGDPSHPAIIKQTVPTIRRLAKQYPLFGICLGHQILALAFGARTYKLKFGHRGANQPVKNLEDNKIYITSQNHGFAVNAASCPADIRIIGVNVNDETVEAMQHKSLPVFSVQYHPEAAPGPWDSKYLFDKFLKVCSKKHF